MRILGFDPGLATVGYGVIESDGRNNVAVDYGVIKTPPDENTAVRLAMIDAAAAELIDRKSTRLNSSHSTSSRMPSSA